MNHQQITAERGRRAADLRAAAVALLEQQAIAAGVMLDLDSDQVVAAGPKSAILYLLSNGAPAATSGDAPDLQQLKALALAADQGEGQHIYTDPRDSNGWKANEAWHRAASPAVVLGLIAQVESLYNAMRLWKQKAEGAARIESAAAPAPSDCPKCYGEGEISMGGAYPHNEPSRCGDCNGTGVAAAPATASGDELAAVLFDGYAVYNEVMANDPHTPRVNADQISDVLDAVVRLIRKDRAAVSAATKPTADLSDLRGYAEVWAAHHHSAFKATREKSEMAWGKLVDYVQSLLATKPAAAPAVPKEWLEFVKQCSTFAGQMVNGNQLSRVAADLLAATPAASTPAAPAEQQQSDSSRVMPPFAAPASLLNADELAALRRFDDCAQDGEGYDVPKEMMQRLAEIGVVRRKSGAYYEHTEYGHSVLASGNSVASTTGEAQTAELEAVVKFLMGETPLEGVEFGEKHPTKAGEFWWRLNLRAAMHKASGAQQE